MNMNRSGRNNIKVLQHPTYTRVKSLPLVSQHRIFCYCVDRWIIVKATLLPSTKKTTHFIIWLPLKRRSVSCTSHPILYGWWNREEWDGLGMWRVCERRAVCIGSCWGSRKGEDQWGDLGVDGWKILGWISGKWDVGIWTGLGWLNIDRWRTLVMGAMNFQVLWNAGKLLTICKPVSFSRRTLHHEVSK